MHTNSKLLFKKYAKNYFKKGIKVLEVGPDGYPSSYQKIISNSSIIWHTLDINDNPKLTYRCSNEYDFPIEDSSYDIIICGQVLEHVRKIWLWVKELERICANDGYIILISPVSWPYHEAPVDCWRVYPDGMKALLDDFTNLNILTCLFASLELPNSKNDIPYSSPETQNFFFRLFYKFTSKFRYFGIPVIKSYDLITIAKKI